MARGEEGKLRRRNKRKEDRQTAYDLLNGGGGENGENALMEEVDPNAAMATDGSGDDDDEPEFPMPPHAAAASSAASSTKLKKKKSSPSSDKPLPSPPEVKIRKKTPGGAGGNKNGQGIKTTPLILLCIFLGTTILPGIIYASDFLGNYFQKHNVLGSVGYRLGIGATPKKRVLSFYEKHDPNKLHEVPAIMSKYYGDYPKLIKRLERKYQDYGYFMGWEDDESPFKLATEKLDETRQYLFERWQLYAPRFLKTATRNIKFNLLHLYKKSSKVWKKRVWPHLEPIVGVPKGGEAQKRKDAAEARKRKAETGGKNRPRRRNKDFRDDDEEQEHGRDEYTPPDFDDDDDHNNNNNEE